MCRPLSLMMEALWNLHSMHITFNIRLTMIEDKIDLSLMMTVEEGQYQVESYWCPIYNCWCVGFPEVHSMDLFSPMDSEASLPLLDFSSCDATFGLHFIDQTEGNTDIP